MKKFCLLSLGLILLAACAPQLQAPLVWVYAAPYSQVMDALCSSVAQTVVTRSFLGLQSQFKFGIEQVDSTNGVLRAGTQQDTQELRDRRPYNGDYPQYWTCRDFYGVEYTVRPLNNYTEVTANVYGDVNADISSDFISQSLNKLGEQFQVVQRP